MDNTPEHPPTIRPRERTFLEILFTDNWKHEQLSKSGAQYSALTGMMLMF